MLMRLIVDYPLEFVSFRAISLPDHEPCMSALIRNGRFLGHCPRNVRLISSIPLCMRANQVGENALIFDGYAGEGFYDSDIRGLLANGFPGFVRNTQE